MFLRKLQFAASYRCLFMMLLKEIDPAQEFPGNIPSLYFHPFHTLVFRLNPYRIPHQENSFQFLI